MNTGQSKLAVVVGLVFLIGFYKLAVDSPLLEWLRATVQLAGPWAPLAYVALRSSTYIVAPVSLPGIELMGGLLFGLVPGTMLSLVGQTLGGSVNFWLARALGRRGVERLLGKKATLRIDELHDRAQGWKGLLFARLMIPGYDFLSYVVGLTPLRFYHYVWVTALGGIPSTAFNVALGPTLLENPLWFFALSLAMGALVTIVMLTQQRITTGKWKLPYVQPNEPARSQELPSPRN
ncbi:MAG: TVP38/TMEM64 family protein [Chloroflexi bacterium]|nr:TVP38/TMEM64 family protein [Chloroflexota bacterium]